MDVYKDPAIKPNYKPHELDKFLKESHNNLSNKIPNIHFGRWLRIKRLKGLIGDMVEYRANQLDKLDV
jgi:hypothetical protein